MPMVHLRPLLICSSFTGSHLSTFFLFRTFISYNIILAHSSPCVLEKALKNSNINLTLSEIFSKDIPHSSGIHAKIEP